MRFVSTLAAGALLASQAHAQVVQWDITKQAPPGARLRKRQGKTFEQTINNDVMRGGYFASVSMGSPPQQLTLQLDTGSSDIWAPSSGAQVCSAPSSATGSRGGDGASDGDQGCSLGSFNYQNSDTFQVVGENFDIAYVDGSFAKGDYFTDDFSIGGASLTNMTMGLGLNTDIPYGLVGVGYALNEAIVSDTRLASSAYANLPVQLVNEGLIPTAAYSLWLNDLDASKGQILFGGVDTKKFEGEMKAIDVLESQPGVFRSFEVTMTSLTAKSPSGSDVLGSGEFALPVVLDSGTTLSYLPTALAVQVWKEVGAVYLQSDQNAFIPCDMQNSPGTFEFGFAGPNGPRISVDMTELVLPLGDNGEQGPPFPSGRYQGREACQFGIQNYTSEPYLLGDTFLRSAYVVYDLENNQIGLAKTDFNSTESNVVPFAGKKAPIPSATVVQDQVKATAGASGAMAEPTYGASSGFTSAAAVLPVFGWAQAGVVSITMLMALAGSGLLAWQ